MKPSVQIESYSAQVEPSSLFGNMVLKKCCCCYSLQTGTIVISIIGLVSNFVYGILLAIQLGKIRHQHQYTGQFVFTVLAAVFETVASFVLVIFNVALFRGAYLQRRPLVVAWLWCDVITICTRDVHQVIRGFTVSLTYGNPVLLLIYVIIILIAIGFGAYVWWAVYSFSEELKVLEDQRANIQMARLV